MDKRERELLQQLGRQIRAARKSSGFSQEGMAAEAALDRAYYGRVERGEANVSAINLQKIASALSLEVSDLFPRTVRAKSRSANSRGARSRAPRGKQSSRNEQ